MATEFPQKLEFTSKITLKRFNFIRNNEQPYLLLVTPEDKNLFKNKNNWRFLRKLEIDRPEDIAIPLLVIYPKDAPQCHKGTCSTMFIVALFVITRS